MTGALIGLVGLYALMIAAGKHWARPRAGSLLFVLFIAVLQTAAVMFFTYSAKIPVTQ